MNIQYLIQILQNKITILGAAKSQAVNIGDLEQVNAIDKELLDTQNTFSQLTLLSDMAQAAQAANSTTAEVVASGLDSIQNIAPSIQGPSSGAIINGYNVSAYATDPLYENKIRTILSQMPVFNIVQDIDTYIQGVAFGSPITGEMVYNAVKKYSIDLPLLVAIMQNDSSFGTAGVGARTFNPGNVGNTGYAEQTFPSWADGVFAVAEWLSRHHADTTELIPAAIIEPVAPNTPIVAAPVEVTPIETTPALLQEGPEPIIGDDVSTDDNYVEHPISTTSSNATSTATSTTAATTTNPVLPDVTPAPASTSTATSSTPILTTEATSTPAVIVDSTISSSTNATSTNPITVDFPATSTPPIDTITPPSILNSSTTDSIIPAATSTSARSTVRRKVAMDISPAKRRRM